VQQQLQEVKRVLRPLEAEYRLKPFTFDKK
jgi:hypothetical protein